MKIDLFKEIEYAATKKAYVEFNDGLKIYKK